MNAVLYGPDGRRLAHWAETDEGCLAVLDGVEGPRYDAVGGFAFSGDGSRFAYHARKRGGRHLVVVAGAEGPEFDDAYEVRLDSGGGRVAYFAREGDRWRAFDSAGGSGSESWDDVKTGSLVLSSAGGRLAYVARAGDDWFVVLDGERRGPWIEAGPVVFSDDGRHHAFLALAPDGHRLVVDGRAAGPFDEFFGSPRLGAGSVRALAARGGEIVRLEALFG